MTYQTISIVRHGPKNNDPKAHQTGVEALLDPSKIHRIIHYANSGLLNHDPERDGTTVAIETTPIDRAVATGQIVYDVMRMDPQLQIAAPRIDELIGSSGIHPETKKAVNLAPKAMSKIWGDAKKDEKYALFEGENKPLAAWIAQGLHNPQADDPTDPGISLYEIACRLGTYVHQQLENPSPKHVVAFGHSGDIEPFLYLCMEMMNGRDGKDTEKLKMWFRVTGGAFEPLSGLRFTYYPKEGLFLQCQKGGEIRPMPIGKEILQEQARWFKEHGKSKKVLEAKLRAEKK